MDVVVVLVPVFGPLFAWLLLGERPTPLLLLGGTAILVGVGPTTSAPGGQAAPVSRPPAPREVARPVD